MSSAEGVQAVEDVFLNWNDNANNGESSVADTEPHVPLFANNAMPTSSKSQSNVPATDNTATHEDWNDDLSVAVSGYIKISNNYETYIAFEVTTQSKRENMSPAEYQVSRRFNDFLWLRARLEIEFPMSVLPPLPDKHAISQLERFAGSFIDQRKVALERFLKRLARHTLTSLSETFVAFLTMDKNMFTRYQNEHPLPGNLLSRLMSNISNHVITPLTSYPTEQVTIQDPFYQIFKETEDLHSVMNRMESVCERLGEEKINLEREVREMVSLLASWAHQESVNEEASRSTPSTTSSAATGTSVSASDAIYTLSTAWEKWCTPMETGINVDRQILAPLFHEYSLYATIIGQLLRKRCDIQQQLHSTRQELSKFRDQLSQLSNNGGSFSSSINEPVEEHNRPDATPVSLPTASYRRSLSNSSSLSSSFSVSSLWKKKQTPEEMQESLQQKIDQLVALENDYQNRLDVYSEEFLADYARWRREKRRDFSSALKQLADAQVTQSNAAVEAWSQALHSLTNFNKFAPSAPTSSALSELGSANVSRPSEGGSSWHAALQPVQPDESLWS